MSFVPFVLGFSLFLVPQKVKTAQIKTANNEGRLSITIVDHWSFFITQSINQSNIIKLYGLADQIVFFVNLKLNVCCKHSLPTLCCIFGLLTLVWAKQSLKMWYFDVNTCIIGMRQLFYFKNYSKCSKNLSNFGIRMKATKTLKNCFAHSNRSLVFCAFVNRFIVE